MGDKVCSVNAHQLSNLVWIGLKGYVQYCDKPQVVGLIPTKVRKNFHLPGVDTLRDRIIIYSSEGSKSSNNYLSDTNRFDVSSKGPSSEISVLVVSRTFAAF